MRLSEETRQLLARCVVQCTAAHHPDPASHRLAVADVRFALVKASAGWRLMDYFEQTYARCPASGMAFHD